MLVSSLTVTSNLRHPPTSSSDLTHMSEDIVAKNSSALQEQHHEEPPIASAFFNDFDAHDDELETANSDEDVTRSSMVAKISSTALDGEQSFPLRHCIRYQYFL